eukprot:TRINITY_DN2327_c0_g1_i1.p1 TRINITY_DN2327_c0_g1~~TRINITY_DN2327_c0_g1_i1.p1  ORF type:complete len:256 (-),score=24.59 TRINITY_DN2327_c0_g1_i1:372-1139(-)
MLRLPSSSGFHLCSSSRTNCPLPSALGMFSRRCSSAQLPVQASGAQIPWLIVGLGNPGSKFVGTRHNTGFALVDAIAAAEGIKLSVIQHKSLVGKGHINEAPVLLAKPQTYMNLVGEALSPMAAYYRIPVSRVLVLVDDLDLEFGVMRLVPRGGHGGHNGMKSVVDSFRGNTGFPRLRVGIGRPPGSMDVRAYVLQKFSGDERDMLEHSFQRGVDAVRLVTSEGIDRAVSTWTENRRVKTPTIFMPTSRREQAAA